MRILAKTAAIAAVVGGATLLVPGDARAFCGFYVSPGDSRLVNNATEVVLMRDGTRTVLSMENNYQGPPAEFAMVVPVPTVLHEGDVKTLPKSVFDKIDTMGSPRLVEYWEQDPCAPEPEYDEMVYPMMAPSAMASGAGMADDKDYGVKIEAQFKVGEYDVVILSAKESTGLDRYLRDQHYRIPAGAEPLLRPYVEAGMKFFVAKVDPKKVKFEHGMAQLSPLRFHYDSDEFALPIRLGLANSPGVQDLVVNILAPHQRYEVANYKNITIPTNLDVKDDVRARFREFYAALFDRTAEQNPGAVVTEYAWDASTCDPCPGPQLDESDFATVGADVLGSTGSYDFVLTRLHARYRKDGAPNDLVFRTAAAIVGGREMMADGGKLEQRSRPDSTNNFQGRYVIRHAWTGPMTCQAPKRGRWGGPWEGVQLADGQLASGATPATNVAFAPRGSVQLPNLIAQDVPEIGVKQGVALPMPTGAGFKDRAQGCTCDAGETGVGGLAGGAATLGIVAGVLLRRRPNRLAKR